MTGALEILVRAIADSPLCICDTTLPKPVDCLHDCAQCILAALEKKVEIEEGSAVR
ncbi:MAG: hypothetical protein PHS57_06050 [Alphaproteobacteria bacterium]|nr:hypothetical protein [Alphaproteobacteria bacterium]